MFLFRAGLSPSRSSSSSIFSSGFHSSPTTSASSTTASSGSSSSTSSSSSSNSSHTEEEEDDTTIPSSKTTKPTTNDNKADKSAPSSKPATMGGSDAITTSGSSSSINSSAPPSAPSTPKKRGASASPKKGNKLGAAAASAKTTPFKTALSNSTSSKPATTDKTTPTTSTSAENDSVIGAAPSRQNVVVCVRMRPARQDAAPEPIWSFDRDQNQIVPTENHPSIAKRAGSSATAGSAIPASASASFADIGDDEQQASTYKFQFDKLLLGEDKTDDMYDSHIAPVVQAAMEGYNGTVFAYGQTGSGKTHTMSGSSDEPGVIPRAVQQVFSTIQQEPNREYLLRVSYLEIYNETLKDLLAPLAPTSSSASAPPADTGRPASPTKGGSSHSAGSSQSSSLRIIEDQKQSRVIITGLREEIVTDPNTVLDLIQKGQEARHVGATDWNERSSRSHCVFQVTIESRAKSELAAETNKKNTAGKQVRISQLNLIDLAGSERAASQAERRKEGAFINKSLLTLGTVIAKLTEPQATGSSSTSDLHIPYRDSKLTRILQTSLSGNARIAVICTLSPDVKHAVETLSTLKFGKRCKMVVTTAKKGTTMDDKALLQKYRRELDALRAKLEAGSPALRGAEDSEDRESKEKLAALNEQKEVAAREVEEMNKKRSDLRNQIDHLTRLILTSQNVAKERRTLSSQHGADADGPDGTPRRKNYGFLERRGPRMSDLGSLVSYGGSAASSPRVDGAGTPTLSGTKPFELEAELAALKRQLREQVESRQALVAAHHAELATRDAREQEMAEAIRMNEEELDEAEVAYDRLKAERDEARRVALAEQDKAREHKRHLEDEKEANRILKLVAKSRGAEEDAEVKKAMDDLREQLRAREEELQQTRASLQDELEQAKKDLEAERQAKAEIEAQAQAHKGSDDEAQEEFKQLVNGSSQREEELDRRAKELEEAERALEQRRAELESSPRHQQQQQEQDAAAVDKLKAQLDTLEAANHDLEKSVRDAASRRVEVEMELRGAKDEIARLEKERAAKPLPVPTASSRLRTESGGLGLNRGGSVREYRRYKADEFGSGPQDAEIERLNAVITSQRAIMADLEKSVASWKNRLKAQADLIQKLAAHTPAPLSEVQATPRTPTRHNYFPPANQPSPLPLPPSTPSPRKRRPRPTIENELLALKASPRVETGRTRFNNTSAAAYYI